MGRFKGWLHFEWLHHLIIWPYLNCLNGFGVLRYVEIIPNRARGNQIFWIVMWTGPCEPTVQHVIFKLAERNIFLGHILRERNRRFACPHTAAHCRRRSKGVYLRTKNTKYFIGNKLFKSLRNWSFCWSPGRRISGLIGLRRESSHHIPIFQHHCF